MTNDRAVPYTLVAGAIVAAVAIGRAVQFGNGGFTPDAFACLVAAVVALLVGWLAPARWLKPSAGEQVLLVLLAAGLAYQFAVLSTSAPAIYLRPRAPEPWKTYQGGLGVAAVCSALLFAESKHLRRLGLAGLFVTYAVLGNWLINTSPEPVIDVWHIHRESVASLLNGENPYAITFRNIYPDGRYFGPGMVENGRLMFGYTYPPLSLLLSVPGQVLGGDYRYSLLACNLLTAVAMAAARPSRIASAAAALFLFTPRAFFVLEQGWTEPMLLACVAAATFTALRAPRAFPYALGLMVASKQYAFLLLFPALWLAPEQWRGRAGLVGVAWRAALPAVAVTLPLFAWNPGALIHSVFIVQFGLPFRADSLNFSAWAVQQGWQQPPAILGWLGLLPAYAATVLRSPRNAGWLGICAGTTLLCFVAFNRQAFCNYYFFILGALLLGVATATTRNDDSASLANQSS